MEAFQLSTIKTIPAADTKSDEIPFKDFAQGGFVIPTGFEGTAVSFEVCATREPTAFVPFHNSTTNTLVSVPVSPSIAYAFPLDLFPFAWCKIVSNATESAERAIQIAQKY